MNQALGLQDWSVLFCSRCIEKATKEGSRVEDWTAIMEFCDILNRADESGRQEAVRAIGKRLANKSDDVAMLTASVFNC